MSLYALQADIESLFEYMRALASQELNPMIIPPDILKNILHKIETDIKSHARLKFCDDLETNIWSYYRTIKLTPRVLEALFDVDTNCSPNQPITTYEFI